MIDGVPRDPRPPLGARHVLDRPLRRHEPEPVRGKSALRGSRLVLDKVLGGPSLIAAARRGVQTALASPVTGVRSRASAVHFTEEGPILRLNRAVAARCSAAYAALAFGVAACGDDDNDSGGSRRRAAPSRRPAAPSTSTPASRCRARRRTRPTPWCNGIKLALEGGRQQGRQLHVKYQSLDDSTRPGRQLGSGEQRLGERPQGRPGRQGRLLHRRVQLGRAARSRSRSSTRRGSRRSPRPTRTSV